MILSSRACHPCVWLLHVVRVRRFEVVCTAHGGSLCLAAVPLSTALPADDEVFPFYELRAAAVDLRSGEAYVRALYRKPKYKRLGALKHKQANLPTPWERCWPHHLVGANRQPQPHMPRFPT